MSTTNKALIETWFEEVWNKGRPEALEEMLADNFIYHGLPNSEGQPISVSEYREFHRKFRGAFPDVQVTVNDTVSEGDKIAALCTVRATHLGDHIGIAPTNRSVEISGISISIIKDGKFTESWNQFDFMSLYQQLGVIPTKVI